MARASRKTKAAPETKADDVKVVETEAAPEAPVTEDAGMTEQGLSLSDYEKRLPEGFGKDQARVLAQNFHVGRAYQAGALVLIFDEPIASVTSLADVLVLDNDIAKTLELQGVIKPLPEA